MVLYHPSGLVNLNLDGSAIGNLGMTGVGGAIGDSFSMCLFPFSGLVSSAL